MFIFIRLVLAHFVGDFPLQFDSIYRLKHKGLKGTIPHALLVSLSFIVFLWPYLDRPGVWMAIFFLGITHLFQDTLKLSFSQLKYSFWTYLLDQCSHIALIAAVVFLTSIKNLPAPQEVNRLIKAYNSDVIVMFLIAMIFATYNGFYLARSFKNTFFGGAGKYNIFEKWYGIAERAIIVFIFFYGGFYLLFIPVIIVTRILLYWIASKRHYQGLDIDKEFVSVPDMLINWTIAIATGLSLYVIISHRHLFLPFKRF
jgi:hypothetical protein